MSNWLDHYVKSPTENWSCYNPSNMQTRAFSCKHHLWHNTDTEIKPTFELAKSRMKLFDFVGISERFRESLCVFSAVVRSTAPQWCNCSNTKAWTSFRGTRHRSGEYPDHRDSELTHAQRQAIQNLTSEDDKLYKFAMERFDAEIAKYEAQGILKMSKELCRRHNISYY